MHASGGWAVVFLTTALTIALSSAAQAPSSVGHAPGVDLSDAGQPEAEAPFSDRLTGDWGGFRTRLAERGFTIDLESTHYYQGLLSGSGSQSFDYGGRIDALLSLDTGRFGLWEGGALRTHTEYRYGDLNARLGGALLATDAGLVFPTGDDDEWVLSSIHFEQRFGDRLSLLLGRINAVDLIAADPFFGGAGRSRFMNLALAAPPSGVTPAVFVGGVLTLRTAPLAWTLMVYDPVDRTHDYWPKHLFDDVGVSLTASYTGKLAGRTTRVAVTGTYSTKDGVNLEELLLPSDLQTGDRDYSWFLGVQFSHFLRESVERPGDGWGLFLKLGTSDGNPNPFEGTVLGGVGGKGLFASRPEDAFGLGYFYVNFSDDLQRSLRPLVAFNDEQGIEAFYKFVVTDWLLVTADLQYVEPAQGDKDDALVGGLRATIRF